MTDTLLEAVQSKYGAVAESALSNNHAGLQPRRSVRLQRRGTNIRSRQRQYGPLVRQSHRNGAPDDPVRSLSISARAVVWTCFLLQRQLAGPGRVIDMTLAMIKQVCVNAAHGGYVSVQFYQATIDRIPWTTHPPIASSAISF